MIEKDQGILNELSAFFFKIFIPAFVAIAIKTAIQVKKEKMNLTRVLISFVAGVGCAYFVYPFIENSVSNSYKPLLVGVVAISGEKIAEYFVYKFKIDKFLSAFIDSFFERIKGKK